MTVEPSVIEVSDVVGSFEELKRIATLPNVLLFERRRWRRDAILRIGAQRPLKGNATNEN